MKITGIIRFLVISFIMLCGWTIQLPAQDCREYLASYISDMNKYSEPLDDVVYYMHFIVRSYPGTESTYNHIPDMESKLYVTKNRKHYISDNFQFHSDSSVMVYVNEQYRQIVISNADAANNAAQMRAQAMQGIHQTLLDSAVVNTCSDTTIMGKPMYFLSLAVPEAIQEQTKIQGVKYFFTKHSQKLYLSVLDYIPNQQISEQYFEYKTISFNYQGTVPTGTLSVIYTDTGSLKPKYAHYSIIDNR